MKAFDYYMSLEKYDLRYWKEPKFLTKVVQSFAKKYFDLETHIVVESNGRLGNTLARFIHKANIKYSVKIDINKKFLEVGTREEIAGAILHEAIHHVLYELDRPYRDGELYFERELFKHGAPSTHTLKPKMERETYICSCCEKIVAIRSRKSPALERDGRYRTNCCMGNIKYGGRRIIER